MIEKHPWIPTAIFFGLLGIALAGVIVATRSVPQNGRMPQKLMDQDMLRGLLSGMVCLLLLGLAFFSRKVGSALSKKVRGAITGALVICTVAGGTLYFYTHRGMTINDYLNFHDLYHYFLGCKYYAETEYTELYNCHLKADAERPDPHYRKRDRARDLKTYATITAPQAIENADCSRFSPERWEEFKEDSAFFSEHLHRGAMNDHGYNGTPFSAAVAGAIANLPVVSYRNLVYLTFVDLFGLIALFALVAWGFGPRLALIVALFQFVNFGDYYYHVSFFRYWWLVTLGAGITFLFRKHYAKAAVFLTASAMLNVFPLMFLFGFAFKILYKLIAERRLCRAHRKFLMWGVIGTLCFGGISLVHEHPVSRYEAFFSKMGRHAGLMTTTRTGYRFNFVFRPSTDRIAAPARKIINKMRGRYKDTEVSRYVLTGLILLLVALLVPRLEDYQAALLGGFALLFMLMSTVVYYYALVALLPLLWARSIYKAKGLTLTALLFGLMSLVYLAWWATTSRAFANNTALTAALTVYMGVSVVVLALKTRLFAGKPLAEEEKSCFESKSSV